MKTLTTAIAILILLMAWGCAQQGTSIQTGQPATGQTAVTAGSQYYTAYNIWRMKSHNMKCINYKFGNNILPAGTMVKDIGTGTDRQIQKPYIRFKTVYDNRSYRIFFTPNWHPGKSVKDYRNLMFTTQTFDELTAGMTDQEIQAIKLGTVVNGMSKNAVLVAYGYPPEHRTGSTYSNTWIYWRNKFNTFRVCFNDNDRTINCH